MANGPNLPTSSAGRDLLDRILKEPSPPTLPIQRPAVFRLAVNLKTVKALDSVADMGPSYLRAERTRSSNEVPAQDA
jgi:hypothetical protein